MMLVQGKVKVGYFEISNIIFEESSQVGNFSKIIISSTRVAGF